jgi:hypothetical protein
MCSRPTVKSFGPGIPRVHTFAPESIKDYLFTKRMDLSNGVCCNLVFSLRFRRFFFIVSQYSAWASF